MIPNSNQFPGNRASKIKFLTFAGVSPQVGIPGQTFHIRCTIKLTHWVILKMKDPHIQVPPTQIQKLSVNFKIEFLGNWTKTLCRFFIPGFNLFIKNQLIFNELLVAACCWRVQTETGSFGFTGPSSTVQSDSVD